jgi:HSP20 family molecular chaperone IbpA
LGADDDKSWRFASGVEEQFKRSHMSVQAIVVPFRAVVVKLLLQGKRMSRMTVFSSPLLLGFDQLEQLLEQATKAGDGYPPYNIERLLQPENSAESWQITVAVAGFGVGDLEVTVDGKQLVIKGRQVGDDRGDYLHKGIAGRSFTRSFVLADGMEVTAAELCNGLLTILLKRILPDRRLVRIQIEER